MNKVRWGLTKLSQEVGFKAAQTLYYAERQAQRIDRDLTASITINLSLLGIAPKISAERFAFLRNQRFAPWTRRPPRGQGMPPIEPTYAYGFENSRNGVPFLNLDGPHNVHVHWAVHIPPARWNDFEYHLRRWIDELAGTDTWAENALVLRKITRPGATASYPIKGASPSTAAHFGKGADHAYQGVIYGRRTGTSRNIGPAARRNLDKQLGIKRKRTSKPRN